MMLTLRNSLKRIMTDEDTPPPNRHLTHCPSLNIINGGTNETTEWREKEITSIIISYLDIFINEGDNTCENVDKQKTYISLTIVM